MIAEINGVNIKIKNSIPPVQGAVGIKMHAAFSEEWSPLAVTAVFRAGTVQRDVIVEDGELTIPWEVLQKAGCPLYLNFYGAEDSGAVVLKTVQVELGTVAPSPDPSGETPEAPTPARADQIQALAEAALSTARLVREQAESGAFDGKDGQDGADGRDGINGTNGTDGVSPRITVSETAGGHTVHITDADGERSFDVLDGAAGEVSRAALASALATKADIDGSYDSMTAGNAKQLVATVGVTDRTPYTFRTAGGSADIGDRAVDKLVGGTIAWNQLFPTNSFTTVYDNKGYSISCDGSGLYTFTVSAETATENGSMNHTNLNGGLKTGHVYVFYNSNPAIEVYLKGDWKWTSGVFRKTGDSVYNNIVFQFTGLPRGEHRDSVVLCDLTQMFGAQIADHVYALEQATPGAGVAWFKKLFPKPTYAYNPGELISVKAAARRTVGFNAWDEEWENGFYNRANGKKAGDTNTSYFRSKNFIKCLPTERYYLVLPRVHAANNTYFAILYFDAEKNYITHTQPVGTGVLLTTPRNAHYMAFYCEVGTEGATYNHDICINLSWDGERDGEYAPYEEHSYPLDDTLTLRGVPKLDSGNNLYFDGDIYESDGSVTRKFTEIDLADVTDWSYYNSYGVTMMRMMLKGIKTSGHTGDYICSHFAKQANAYSASANMEMRNYSFNVYNMEFHVDGITTIAEWKAWLTEQKNAGTPVMLLCYAGEEAETAASYQNPQIVDDFGTEEYIVPEQSGVAVPVGHETVYQVNLRAKLEMAPESPDGDGDYIVRQTNGENRYVPLTIPAELPPAPSADGTYRLQIAVTNGASTLSWVNA